MATFFVAVLSLGFTSCGGDDEDDTPDGGYGGEQTEGTDKLCPDSRHPHAIDMGAAGVWACCNVGASKPEDYGGYYAWGETEEKSDYSWQTYKYWHDKNGDGYYDNDGELDDLGDISGNKSYDVAAAKWGGRWRMPTLNQIQNLINNCSYKWIEVNGIYGGLFTASNGHRIFLPAAGGRYGTELNHRGDTGICWSSTPWTSDRYNAYDLIFNSGGASCYYYDWGCVSGHSVRPVSE